MMSRLLILLLGLVIGIVLVVFLIPMQQTPSDQRQGTEESSSASLEVNGANLHQYGLEEHDVDSLKQSVQHMPLKTTIINPNRSSVGSLIIPSDGLAEIARELPVRISITNADGGVPSSLPSVPEALLSQERTGPQVDQPESAILAYLWKPRRALQSASAQMEERPVIKDADSAHMVRAQRPHRLLESVRESSSEEDQ